MIEFPKKLQEVKRWYDDNLPTISDPAKKVEFQRRVFEQMLALFATLSNDFRELKGERTELERPYWQRLEMPTFIDKQPENAEDPELGARG